jgi:hypothetical protein
MVFFSMGEINDENRQDLRDAPDKKLDIMADWS